MSPVSSGGVASPGKNTEKVASCGGSRGASAKPRLLRAPPFPGRELFARCPPNLHCNTRERRARAPAPRRKKTEPRVPALCSAQRGRLPAEPVPAGGAGGERRSPPGSRGSAKPPRVPGTASTPESVSPTGHSTRGLCAAFPGGSGGSGFIQQTEPPAGPCLSPRRWLQGPTSTGAPAARPTRPAPTLPILPRANPSADPPPREFDSAG